MGAHGGIMLYFAFCVSLTLLNRCARVHEVEKIQQGLCLEFL